MAAAHRTRRVTGGTPAIGELAGRYFVGREAECRLFGRFLAGARPRGAGPILNVFGPAGVGKSTLLDAFRRRAEAAGVSFLYVDLLDQRHRPERLLEHLRSLAGGSPPGPAVVAIDSYEAAGALDRWLREVFLASLPETALVVIAGRIPLERLWHRAPAWRQLVYPLPLAPFRLADTRAYLGRHGIRDEARVRAAHEATGGLPLALSLTIPALQRGEVSPPAGVAGQPEAVVELVARWLREVPGERLRALVEAAAVVQRFDQDLLARLTGSPVQPEEWERLTALSFVRLGSNGWSLHGLVRTTLLRELRWRRPAHLDALRRHALHHCARLLIQDPPAPGWSGILADFFFLLGDALIGAAFFPAGPREDDPGLYVVPATAADLPELEAYHDRCRRLAQEGPAPMRMLDPASGTPFAFPYLWVDFIRAPLDFRALLGLGPGVVRIARDSLGALRGVSVVIPVHAATLPYLTARPVTRAYFAALGPGELAEYAVPPQAATTWFIRHLHTGELDDAPARGALFRDLFGFALRHGRLLTSSPAPFFQELLRRCGFVEVPGATHQDFGPDLPSPTYLLDTRGERLAAFLGRLLYSGAPPGQTGAGDLLQALVPRLTAWAEAGSEWPAAPRPEAPAAEAGGLTPREREVCRTVLEGLANKEIADRLGISPLTVKKHLTRIFAKLGVMSRTQLIRRLVSGGAPGEG